MLSEVTVKGTRNSAVTAERSTVDLDDSDTPTSSMLGRLDLDLFQV